MPSIPNSNSTSKPNAEAVRAKARERGMYRTALKMLFRDKTRYFVLLGAFTFSTLLMTQQAGIFCGLMYWTSATIRLIKAPIWVMDPKLEQVNETKPLRDTDADRVRSVPGVAWAFPIRVDYVKAKLANGDYKIAQLIGLDTTTMMGYPAEILEGSVSDIRLPNAVMVDTLAAERFQLKIGSVFELNDKEARVVAIFEGDRSFTGAPYIVTTFDRAVFFFPPTRKIVSFVLAAPQESISAEALTDRIEKATGLEAKTAHQFEWHTINWYIKNTGIPVSFGMTVLLGFIVGIAVSGQTFYAFIFDNLKHLATFKAMGVHNRLLGKMLLLQSFTVGLLGYGIGVGLGSAFGLMSISKQEPPFYMPYALIFLIFFLIVMICAFACFLGWRKVKKLEAGMVFRV